MKKLFLFCNLFLLVFISTAQEKTTTFPNDFLGIYKGTLQIHSPRGKQEIPMEFHMVKTDSVHKFDYKLVYNGQPRNYTLLVKDSAKGIYEIDENNGIILPSKLANNTLYSFFEVQGNFLSSRLAFSENQLEFEILFTATKNKTTTGKGTEEIPFVYGYPISVVQKAVLKRKVN
ncbi:hypothetical protein [Tenacibaculum crassostreae]|uniref:hypothetical protein n=1 Tax=Tenacibaculum crassostreae TaxID=502683 RepID=UPI00389441A9